MIILVVHKRLKEVKSLNQPCIHWERLCVGPCARSWGCSVRGQVPGFMEFTLQEEGGLSHVVSTKHPITILVYSTETEFEGDMKVSRKSTRWRSHQRKLL